MLRSRRATVPILLFVGLLITIGPGWRASAANNINGSKHDFRAPEKGGSNRRYPYLAQLTGANTCSACHTSHNAAGGSLLPTDFGLRLNHPMEDSSAKCLSCHDGVIETPVGNDVLPSAKSLRWHWHKVEFAYPPRSAGFFGPAMGMFGFRPLVHDAQDRMYVPDAGSKSLPLSYDADGQRAKATCVTCHNPHDPGRDGRFLRGGSQFGLCGKCHLGIMM